MTKSSETSQPTLDLDVGSDCYLALGIVFGAKTVVIFSKRGFYEKCGGPLFYKRGSLFRPFPEPGDKC